MADETKLGDFKPDPNNARQHSASNGRLIRKSLKEVGAARSIVVDEHGTILAGNATVEEAKALGLRVRVIDTDGDTLIAVRRSDLTDEQKERLALYDNRTGELAEWNTKQLHEVFKRDDRQIIDLFEAKELDKMFRPFKDSARSTRTDDDDDTGKADSNRMVYRIIIDCEDENDQTRLLEFLTANDISARALIS